MSNQVPDSRDLSPEQQLAAAADDYKRTNATLAAAERWLQQADEEYVRADTQHRKAVLNHSAALRELRRCMAQLDQEPTR
jgi:hypothetical protein